jgi:hypothetical protein
LTVFGETSSTAAISLFERPGRQFLQHPSSRALMPRLATAFGLPSKAGALEGRQHAHADHHAERRNAAAIRNV